MQATAQTPAAPQAPLPPDAPAAPTTITTPGPSGTTITLRVPTTTAELSALIAQREELSNQLTNVASRRSSLSEQIRNAPDGASRTGLEDRIRVLDQRIVTLESDLAAIGRQIAAASPELLTEVHTPPSGGDDFEEGFFAGGFSAAFTLLPIFYLYLRRRWKKKGLKGKMGKPDMSSESAQRLERLENGMESIAIEIERVSEGQRFVTRLLSEGQGPLSARRIAEPAAASTPDTGR
jgi:hypothetical protein